MGSFSSGDFVRNPAFVMQDVVKDYVSREGAEIRALDHVSFEAQAGRITCLVGPTGSGKSTVLRILSGMEKCETGMTAVDGQHPERLAGKIGYLTQRHTLFPWLRVKDNIGLPLELKGVGTKDRVHRVREIADTLGLQGAEYLYPYELSGGMQQRAALGRLLASDAPYWLLDEPFSALDERTLHQLQRMLLSLALANFQSVLFVTHSIDEAVFLADRVIVLSAGPGRVIETFDLEMTHPRDRLSPEYGAYIERIRQKIESVLRE